MGIFKPTGTSAALISAIKPHIKGGKLLDLGCGSGVIGAGLSHLVDDTYASDISDEAVLHTIHEYPDLLVRCGNLFEPWEDTKFDYIVDDVSGVAEEIAGVSPWFDGVLCNSGVDGANLIVEVLKKSPDYLNKEGKLFFPVVSLSNVERILDTARQIFNVELLSRTHFPLPSEMLKHRDMFRKLKSAGIQFEERFGMIVFYTDIYMGKVKC